MQPVVYIPTGKTGTMGQLVSKKHERTDALDYMQTMLGQLRTMAQAERCDLLAYMIEMAYIEASDIIRGSRPRKLADAVEIEIDIEPARASKAGRK